LDDKCRARRLDYTANGGMGSVSMTARHMVGSVFLGSGMRGALLERSELECYLLSEASNTL